MTRTFDQSCKVARSAGFPRRHIRSIMGGAWNPTEEQAAAWAVIESAVNESGTALLIGTNSGGKTHLLTLAGCVWSMRGTPDRARYWTLNDLLDDKKRTFDGRSDAADDPIRMARECGLLVLDELGETRATSVFAREEFAGLIDARYRDEKPTILASNMTERAFIDRFGASAYERLREGGGVVTCNWSNHRVRIAGKDQG